MQSHAPRVQEKQPDPCQKQLRQKLGGQVPGKAPGVSTASLPLSPYEMKRQSSRSAMSLTSSTWALSLSLPVCTVRQQGLVSCSTHLLWHSVTTAEGKPALSQLHH